MASCMFYSGWVDEGAEYRVSAPEEDNCTKDEKKKNCKKNREYKHVPHKDKPAQVVEKRNARERRRVQAVNTAFARLRKVVPVENDRGKRISKVKTLQYAIDYINALLDLLQQERNYHGHFYNYSSHEAFFLSYADDF